MGKNSTFELDRRKKPFTISFFDMKLNKSPKMIAIGKNIYKKLVTPNSKNVKYERVRRTENLTENQIYNMKLQKKKDFDDLMLRLGYSNPFLSIKEWDFEEV